MMMMMKLPILPCAEKLELVLSTAPNSVYGHQVHAAMLWGKVCLVCDGKWTFQVQISIIRYRTKDTNTLTSTNYTNVVYDLLSQ